MSHHLSNNALISVFGFLATITDGWLLWREACVTLAFDDLV